MQRPVNEVLESLKSPDPAIREAAIREIGTSQNPAALPALDFEGGKSVETSSDPVTVYRGYAEYALRSHWQRPEGGSDFGFVVEVELTVEFYDDMNQIALRESRLAVSSGCGLGRSASGTGSMKVVRFVPARSLARCAF